MGNFVRASKYRKNYEQKEDLSNVSEENKKKFEALDKSLFNEKQLSQIEIGFKRNLDFSKYADPKYNHSQMFELRIALQYSDNLKPEDLDFLFDNKWNNEQMRELRLGMLAGIDYSIFADTDYNSTIMRNVRIDLENSES